jgi:hypothetical protein
MCLQPGKGANSDIPLSRNFLAARDCFKPHLQIFLLHVAFVSVKSSDVSPEGLKRGTFNKGASLA